MVCSTQHWYNSAYPQRWVQEYFIVTSKYMPKYSVEGDVYPLSIHVTVSLGSDDISSLQGNSAVEDYREINPIIIPVIPFESMYIIFVSRFPRIF